MFGIKSIKKGNCTFGNWIFFFRHPVDNQGFPGVFARHSLLYVSVIAFAVPFCSF